MNKNTQNILMNHLALWLTVSVVAWVIVSTIINLAMLLLR